MTAAEMPPSAQISRASATQRAGRAGRLGPGRCLRLWSEDEQQGLAAQATPEILQADLAPLALALLSWGVDDPAELRWLDAPPAGAWAEALEKNNWTPALLTGPAFATFVDDEFASLRAVMVKSGMV